MVPARSSSNASIPSAARYSGFNNFNLCKARLKAVASMSSSSTINRLTGLVGSLIKDGCIGSAMMSLPIFWPGENKTGTPPCRLHGDFTTIVFDDFLDQCQAHSAAFNFVTGFECLKHAKDALLVLFWNTGAVIADTELKGGFIQIATTDANHSLFLVVVFDRIGQ